MIYGGIKKLNTRKLTKLSLLTAIALIIFIIEMRLPDLSGIPGVKLGLANIITVYALYHFKAYEVAMVVFVRILLGSVFGGNMSAMIYSLSGAVLCLAGMIFLKKIINEKYIWLSSVAGAILHNTGQILAAMAVTRSTAVFAYYPVLVVSGCIAGVFTGICASILIKRVGDKI